MKYFGNRLSILDREKSRVKIYDLNEDALLSIELEENFKERMVQME